MYGSSMEFVSQLDKLPLNFCGFLEHLSSQSFNSLEFCRRSTRFKSSWSHGLKPLVVLFLKLSVDSYLLKGILFMSENVNSRVIVPFPVGDRTWSRCLQRSVSGVTETLAQPPDILRTIPDERFCYVPNFPDKLYIRLAQL